ncbi:type I restriction enzyme S subunit [Pedobacter sp. AK013]|uniref:restriction endonuclease subunit S n=1 Tax=Pedobacter sp. AK013 TaxID=2723071 RepID=UPI0016193890|nr:restriction endonuclease subunit S [Pedobacter sp. AK013]MBB6240188.1 type I restriction enzyme S subunit [Pedobacter sp. AK013]
MSKEDKLVPKQRFNEFKNDGGWNLNHLGAVVKEINEKTGSNRFTLLSITSGIGLVSQLEKFGREIAGESYKNYYVINKGDFAYNKSSTKLYPEGEIALLETFENGAVPNSIFTCFRVNKSEILPNFLKYPFINNVHGKWLKKFISVGARANGALQVNTKDLFTLPISYPSLTEQQKIADCLSSLDDLITAENEKLGALKKHKKGLMQQLFPAEGEKVPKLRFPEFKISGDWEFAPIGIKIDLLSGYAFKSHEISDNVTGTRLVRGINVTEGRIRHSIEIDRYFLGSLEKLGKFKVQKNDLVIAMDGSKVGKNTALVTASDEGGLLVQRVARLRADSESLIKYIFHQVNSVKFHSYVDRINTSSGIPHISSEQIKSFQIHFPPLDDELQKIESFITYLNSEISEQTKKINELKLHKKGLMQQLFPTIN